MSEQTELSGAESRAPQGDQTYTVQRQRIVAEPVAPQPVTDEPMRVEAPEVSKVWIDIATVTVPPRTIRATVVKRAFEQAGLTVPVGERYDVRVLDADSARVIPVGSKQPPPELVIGEVA